MSARFNYPNAALSSEALREWAQASADVSSRWEESPERILAERTKSWGKRK